MPYNTSLSAGQRSDRRIAANTRWSRLSTSERLEQTAPGRRAMFERFLAQVDPEGLLSEAERIKMAENARRVQLAQARLASSKKRRRKDIVASVPEADEVPVTDGAAS